MNSRVHYHCIIKLWLWFILSASIISTPCQYHHFHPQHNSRHYHRNHYLIFIIVIIFMAWPIGGIFYFVMPPYRVDAIMYWKEWCYLPLSLEKTVMDFFICQNEICSVYYLISKLGGFPLPHKKKDYVWVFYPIHKCVSKNISNSSYTIIPCVAP